MKYKLIWHGLLAGLVMNIVGVIVSFAMASFWPKLQEEYLNQAIFRSMTDPLMLLFYLAPFLLGIVWTFVWDFAKKSIASKNVWQNGLYIALMWLIITIPGMLITYASFQVGLFMVFTWILMGFIQYFFGGTLIAKLGK